MKKLSFFLMAMLFSMMSFAQTVLFTQTYPGSPSAWTNAYTNSFYLTTDGYKLTYQNINNGKQADRWTAIRSGSKRAASVATILSEQIAKPIAKVAINFTQVKASSTNALYLEVSATADFASATKIEADIAKGTVEFAIATPAANQYYRVTIDQKKDSDNGFNRWDKVIFYEGEAASGDVEIVAAPEYSVANANFTTPFTLEITSAEGTTLKYTLDNTDPNTSATAVEVATNKTTVEIAKSTVVKAIAIKGELVSVTKTKTYSYVNTPETAYTVAEAIEVINSGLGLDNELYAKGEIYKIDSYNATYKSITYWIKDEANNQLQVYSGRGLNNTDFASKDDLVVGSKVVICGILKKYNSTYEFDKTNYIVSLTLPSYTVTATAENGSVAGLAADGKYEHGAEATLTATAAEGYEFTCWTSGKDTVSTAYPYKFTVTADVALVANFKEAAPTYDLELVAKDLYSASDEVKTQFEGSNSLNPDMTISVTLFASKYGTYTSTGAEEDEFNAFYAGSQILGELTYSYSDELKSDLVVIIGTITDEEETSTIKVTMYEEYLEPTDVVVLNNLQKNVQKMGWMSNLMLFNAANDTIITISGCDGTYGKYSAWGTFGADELEGKGEWKNDGENDVFVGVLYNADKTKVFQVTATTPAEKIKEYTYELADVSFTLSEASNTLIIEAYAEEPEPVQVYLELAGWTPEQTIYAVGEMYGSIANMDNIEGADVANLTYEVESYLEGKELTITAQVEDATGNTYLLILTGEYDSTTTALDNLNTTVAPVKMIENGQLIIINNGGQYNAQGQVVK